MRNSSNVVLAVYPNTRGFGYAFFETATEPQDCGMVSIMPICNGKSLNRIKKFISHYEPTLVVLQDVTAVTTRRAQRVKSLVDSIIQYCKEVNLPTVEYSKEQIKFVFEQFNANTKHDIAKLITGWLPQFKNKLPKLRKPWMCEDYHMGMFDAIALALTHFYLT